MMRNISAVRLLVVCLALIAGALTIVGTASISSAIAYAQTQPCSTDDCDPGDPGTSQCSASSTYGCSCSASGSDPCWCGCGAPTCVEKDPVTGYCTASNVTCACYCNGVGQSNTCRI